MQDVLKATYADLKTVKTRSTCQLILELPIEALTDVVGLLGAPVPGNEVWVAVARLKTGAAVEQIEDHRPVKLAQLAGILCNEGGFWTFLTENGHAASNKDEAAEQVRLICGTIKSRAELDTNSYAGNKFKELRADYQLWLKDAAA